MTLKVVDQNTKMKDYRIRFTNQTDAKALEFESELIKRNRTIPYNTKFLEPVTLNFFQRVATYQNSNQEFYILQVYGADDLPAAQLIAIVHRPGKAPWFARAEVRSIAGFAVNHEAEFFCYSTLPKLLHDTAGAMKLRLQAYRTEHTELLDFECLTRRAGYSLVDPMGATRTLVFEMNKSMDELLLEIDGKTRKKIRHGKDELLVQTLNDPVWIPRMQEALNSAFSRTKGGHGYFDFENMFRLAKTFPDQVLIQGLFLKHRPTELLAFSVSALHGTMFESITSGSFRDPELRKWPFNYRMFWEKASWAKEHGATLVDLGGVTDGGATDPLAGISSFKRHLTKKEMEVAREMEIQMSPAKCKLFDSMSSITERLRGRAPTASLNN